MVLKKALAVITALSITAAASTVCFASPFSEDLDEQTAAYGWDKDKYSAYEYDVEYQDGGETKVFTVKRPDEYQKQQYEDLMLETTETLELAYSAYTPYITTIALLETGETDLTKYLSDEDAAEGDISVAFLSWCAAQAEVPFVLEKATSLSKLLEVAERRGYEKITAENIKPGNIIVFYEGEVPVKASLVFSADDVKALAVECTDKVVRETYLLDDLNGAEIYQVRYPRANDPKNLSGSPIWPLPKEYNSITDNYGPRAVIITPAGATSSFHSGTDIYAPMGTPINAVLPGVVTYAMDSHGGHGIYVKIDHGDGVETLYAHISTLACKKNDLVNQGDIIGYVGSTGKSTGPHLHFEWWENGSHTDAMNHLAAVKPN